MTLHKRDEDKLKPVSVAVSSRFAATNGRLVYAHGAALWPAIIEKAFAKMMGNAYDSLQGSTEGAITAFEAVFGTGTRGSSVASRVGDSLADAKAQSDVVHLVNTGEHVVVSSASHYYAVTGTLPDGLKLRNPHGHDETRSWADLKDFTYQVGRPKTTAQQVKLGRSPLSNRASASSDIGSQAARAPMIDDEMQPKIEPRDDGICAELSQQGVSVVAPVASRNPGDWRLEKLRGGRHIAEKRLELLTKDLVVPTRRLHECTTLLGRALQRCVIQRRQTITRVGRHGVGRPILPNRVRPVKALHCRSATTLGERARPQRRVQQEQ